MSDTRDPRVDPRPGAAIYHRVRFYEGKFSNFDQIKKCDRPAPCWGCQFKHPLCDTNGRVAKEAKAESK